MNTSPVTMLSISNDINMLILVGIIENINYNQIHVGSIVRNITGVRFDKYEKGIYIR